MALTGQGGGGGGMLTPGAQGLQTQYGNRSTSGPASRPAQQQQFDPFDRWELHFQPTRNVRTLPGEDNLSGAYIARNKRAIEESGVFRQDRTRLVALAKRIGVDVSSPGAMGILWLDAVDEARTAAAVDPGIAGLDRGPWEILERWASTGSYEGKATAKGQGSLAGTLTTTSKNVDLTDPKTAMAVIRAALRNRLQRDPSEAEMDSFIADLRSTETKNPSVTTSTQTTDEEGRVTDQSSATTGGAPAPGDFAENWLTEEHDAEADAIRAGQAYFGVAQQLVGAVV